MNTVKKQATKGGSGYRLTQKTLNNLSQFKLSPTAKLVLIYLTSCYNEKNKYIYPKQSKIAKCLGVSERSIVRAISELVKEGLIIIECKYINHYKFTSKITAQCAVNLSDNVRQYDIQQYDNLAHPYIEPIHEPIKNQTNKGGNVYSIEDERTLREYAVKHGAKNINAYVAKIKVSGSAKNILKKQCGYKLYPTCEESQKIIDQNEDWKRTRESYTSSQAWLEFGKKITQKNKPTE